MRKIVVSEFVSLDGVMEDPGGAEHFEHGGWTMPYWDDGIGKVKFDELFASDALLLGRVTYQGFAAAWPSATDEAGFAERMNTLPKYVVSTTLEKAEWTNSHLIQREHRRGGVRAEAARRPGHPDRRQRHACPDVDAASALSTSIACWSIRSSWEVASACFRRDTGCPLRLIDTQTFSSGVVALTYQRRRPWRDRISGGAGGSHGSESYRSRVIAVLVMYCTLASSCR